MSAAVRKARRFARVRLLQHNLAAVAAMKAQHQVDSIEASIDKLVGLRDAMRPPEGVTSGAALASIGEIATRLDQARASVAVAAEAARRRAAAARDVRLLARQQQETADRLTEKAVAAADRVAERKQAQRGLPRRRDQE